MENKIVRMFYKNLLYKKVSILGGFFYLYWTRDWFALSLNYSKPSSIYPKNFTKICIEIFGH